MAGADWDSRWQEPSFSPFWWINGPQVLIRQTVENGWLPRGSAILEIGCGAGQGAAWLQQRGFHVTGIDISPAAIARARRDFGSPEGPFFEVADVSSLDRPDALERQFDVIIDSGCFHILDTNDYTTYTENVAFWLNPGARFLLMVHCHESTPNERIAKVSAVFGTTFDPVSCDARAGCYPGRPDMVVMIFRLLRREDNLRRSEDRIT
jgi:SAM-dependent methyltransferase